MRSTFRHCSITENIHTFFFGCKNGNFHWIFKYIILIFPQNIDCGYTLEPPRRGGSNEYPHSMFGAIPLHTPVFLYKSGVQGGIHVTDMFS